MLDLKHAKHMIAGYLVGYCPEKETIKYAFEVLREEYPLALKRLWIELGWTGTAVPGILHYDRRNLMNPPVETIPTEN